MFVPDEKQWCYSQTEYLHFSWLMAAELLKQNVKVAYFKTKMDLRPTNKQTDSNFNYIDAKGI